MTTPDQAAETVDQEMRIVIFYLTAIAHIDGDFDQRERDYIHQFIRAQVAHRAWASTSDAELTRRAQLTDQWTRYYEAVFADIDRTIKGYFTEPVGQSEDPRNFVFAKLKLRCYEFFRRFSHEQQTRLLQMAEEVICADGVVHPNEAKFRDELATLLALPEPPPAPPSEASDAGATMAFQYINTSTVVVDPIREVPPRKDNHRFFQSFERPYTLQRAGFNAQIQGDLALIDKVVAKLNEKRDGAAGRLRGVRHVSDLNGQEPFLDGFVNVLPPVSDKPYELLVLGDLHGCYACLKAALMQADFFTKMDAYLADPVNAPAMKLVLLGDYIDRGNYGFNGVLRTAMLLFLAAPDHVYLLRGNHEYYLEYGGHVLSGVRPAESFEALSDVADPGVFAAYRRLFEALPTSLLFGPTLFVHAGIPREETLAEKWTDLSSLNDPDVRFQMMWSDPSEVDVVPPSLQKTNARFPFGRQQFRSFMARLGCTTMIRGHEREVNGWNRVYDDPEASLFTLFSSGGATNRDLPDDSNYREVTPVALTIKYKNGLSQLCPFVIDYARYNQPELNGFYRT